MEAIAEYATRCRLPIYSRERFVEEIFYPEVCAFVARAFSGKRHSLRSAEQRERPG